MSAEVKPGYKQTEVGVIPGDWEVKSFAEIGNIKTGPFGTSLKAAEYYAVEGVPLVSVRDIGEGKLTFDEHTPLVPSTVVRRMSEYVLNDGDIVFGRKGGVDRSAIVQKHQAGCFLGSDGIRMRPLKVNHALFIAYQLQRNEIQAWLLKNATGTTMPSMNQAILRRISLPIPTKAEQEAIAEALSDADALIESLEQLIIKKRQIKQGAMQELLTGKKRLPGFSGEWEVKWLGDLFSFSGGYSASRDQLSSEGHCYLHYGDIHGSSKMIIDAKEDYQNIPKLNIPLKRIAFNSFLKDGDVVFVDASEDDEGTCKYIVVVNKDDIPFIAGLHTIVAKSKTSELTHEYRRYCFQTADIHQQFLFFAVGTKVSGISKTNIPKLTLPVPPFPEQAAIAEILMDMDSEIEVLEVKLEKARHLKQGMMHNLLTGKIRLI